MIMDVWALLLQQLFKIKSTSYCLVGRWLLYIPRGIFFHNPIAKSVALRGECAVGWATHYLIGLIYAIAFAALIAQSWLEQPRLAPALLFGLATVVFPFFLMQPALGMGVAASRAAQPFKARLKSVLNHLVFGLGLYLTALLFNLLRPMAA